MNEYLQFDSEDKKRISSLRRTLQKEKNRRRRKIIRRIIRRINRAILDETFYASLASATYCNRLQPGEIRLLRKAISGERRVQFFHIVLKRWAFPSEELGSFNPDKFAERIRFHFRKAGISQSTGWVLYRVHGEEEPHSGKIWPHVHGVAVGDAIDILRGLSAYYSEYDVPDGPKRKVMLQGLRDMNSQCSYIFQTFWPCRYKGPSASDPGKIIRQRYKGRLTDTVHTQWMILMDGIKPISLMTIIGNPSLSNNYRSFYNRMHQDPF
jgi:hypothetical protein